MILQTARSNQCPRHPRQPQPRRIRKRTTVIYISYSLPCLRQARREVKPDIIQVPRRREDTLRECDSSKRCLRVVPNIETHELRPAGRGEHIVAVNRRAALVEHPEALLAVDDSGLHIDEMRRVARANGPP